MRLERLADERARVIEKREDLLALAEEEQRDLADYENEQITKYRTRVVELEDEILALATDIDIQCDLAAGRWRRLAGMIDLREGVIGF